MVFGMLKIEKASGCLPVTEVKEAAVVVKVLVLKAQVRPAAQTIISYTQLLRHSGLCGFSTWRAKTQRDGFKSYGNIYIYTFYI